MIDFLRQIQGIMTLPPSLVELFYEKLQTREVRKRQHLLKAGHICDHIFFVKKGLFRSYSLSGDQQVTNWFMKEADIFTAPTSFYPRIPSVESIQALEDSEVVYLHHNVLEKMYEEFPAFNKAGRMVTEKYMIVLSRYNYVSRIKPADERYRYFEEDFPELIGRVADKDVASFLGMTDVYLSKIKNKK